MPSSDAGPWQAGHVARYIFVPGWRAKLPAAHRALIEAWAASQPVEVEPVELVAAAIRDGQVAGAVIGRTQLAEFLKRPMVVIACRLGPGEGDDGLGMELLRYSVELLSAWATRERGPEAGVLVPVRPDRFVADRARPYWADSGLTVIRIQPEGDQLRVRWFDHAWF